jgi:hypothetical protein
MAVAKDEILDEIRRCAAENGGVPLGRERFKAETCIREHEWRGKYWVAWGDALSEAGLQPNSLQGQVLDDDQLVRRIALLTRKLGRFPSDAHLKLERRSDETFPNSNSVRRRLGATSEQLAHVRAFTAADESFADVHKILSTLGGENETVDHAEPVAAEANGTVYLIKSGRYHKIGRTNAIGRRSYEIALQLPEKSALVHSLETDDPAGIERYWHERFKDRRQNGEWFLLSKADVAAVKRRRRFM